MKKLLFFILLLQPAVLLAHNYVCHYPNYDKFELIIDSKSPYLQTDAGKNYDVSYKYYNDGVIFMVNYENGPNIITIQQDGKSVLTENFIDSQTNKIQSGKYLGKCLKY